MITVIINGEKVSFNPGLILNKISTMCIYNIKLPFVTVTNRSLIIAGLTLYGYGTVLPFVVAVNRSLVVRSKYSNSTYLNDGDAIKD